MSTSQEPSRHFEEQGAPGTTSRREVPPQVPGSSGGHDAVSVALEAARLAGQVIVDRFRTAKKISFKGRANVVTDVDVLAERAALDLLRREYPDFGVLSEESEPVVTESSYTWVVDPLDGSRNYASGIPHVAVVVALARDGEVVLGVTHDPFRNETFVAQEGRGAFLSDARLTISARESLGDCVLGFDMGYVDERAATALDMIRSLWPNMQSIRMMGSSALGLAYVASGRIDLYFHHSLAPWDIASGMLLVSEAGGITVDRQGQPATLQTPSVIASSPHLMDRFLEATDGLEWRR